MNTIEKTFEVPLSFTEIDHQGLEIAAKTVYEAVPNDYNQIVKQQVSLSDLSQKTNPLSETKDSLHGSNTSLKAEMETQEASGSAPLIGENDSKIPLKKTTSVNLILQSPQKRKRTF